MSTYTNAIRRLFALPRFHPSQRKLMKQIDCSAILPGRGERTLITGASGSGKSRLLQKLRETYRDEVCWIDPSKIVLKDQPVIDLVAKEMSIDDSQEKIIQALDLLARVGLAEAWTYLRKPSEISDGQRWRLLLAISIERARKAALNRGIVILATDEFAALLDRITAIIIARALRQLIDSAKEIGVVVVTSHNDLINAFDPHIHVDCDFGVIRIVRRKSPATQHAKRGKQEDQQ